MMLNEPGVKIGVSLLFLLMDGVSYTFFAYVEIFHLVYPCFLVGIATFSPQRLKIYSERLEMYSKGLEIHSNDCFLC